MKMASLSPPTSICVNAFFFSYPSQYSLASNLIFFSQKPIIHEQVKGK